MRAILHAGFHKTGTKTVQHTPVLRIALRPGRVARCDSARACSTTKDPLDLSLLQCELARFAASWDSGGTATYARTYRVSADQNTAVAHVTSTAAPYPAHTTSLEDSGAQALGPLDSILDLVDLPPAARDQLLELNPSDLDDDALHSAKKHLRLDTP